jgi:alkylation response protein AidB-like acyl-CoA dehydrogenase
LQTALSQGRAPGVEGSLLKLAFSRHAARLGDVGVGLLGATALVSDDRHPEADFWRERFLNQWAMRIGGGTDEIQRNQIAERVLGLPREPSAMPS